ncbi:MAG: anti-sigma factor [Betaproteobacteria bacterium]
MDLGRPDRTTRLDALAAEYALGTLSLRARRRLAAIARTDATVAGAIADWDARLAPLAAAVPPVTPPPRVWSGIQQRLGLRQPSRQPPGPTQWWASLGLWRGLTLAGFALAFALGVTLLAPRTERPEESIVVVLAGPDAKPALVATADRGGRYLTIKAVLPVALDAGRALELWALPEGRDPLSLGLIPANGVGRVALGAPAGIALQKVPALAVSLEPSGGSPTGKPTGPVLYSGSVQTMY